MLGGSATAPERCEGGGDRDLRVRSAAGLTSNACLGQKAQAAADTSTWAEDDETLQLVSRLVSHDADAVAFSVVEEGEPAHTLDSVRR